MRIAPVKQSAREMILAVLITMFYYKIPRWTTVPPKCTDKVDEAAEAQGVVIVTIRCDKCPPVYFDIVPVQMQSEGKN